MKSIIRKSIKVFTNGTISLSYGCLKSTKQVIFCDKDMINLLFSRKLKKNQSFHNSPSVSYKSKYKL